MSYDELVEVMTGEYDNEARQLSVLTELSTLTFEKIRRKADVSDADECLTRLVDTINSLAPQCPPAFRRDENKSHFLRQAVIRQPWAEAAIADITSSGYSFNKFVTSLRVKMQLFEEKKSLQPENDTQADTLYQRYGRPPSHVTRRAIVHEPLRQARSTSAKEGKNPIGKNGKRMLCKICDADDHFARDCKERDVKGAVTRQLQKGVPAVTLLASLVSNYDRYAHNVDDPCSPDPAQLPLHDDNFHTEVCSELEAFEKLHVECTEDEDSCPDREILAEHVDSSHAINNIAMSTILQDQNDVSDTVHHVQCIPATFFH